MPRCLVKLEEDLYCEWSTVVDCPVSVFTSIDDIKRDVWSPDIDERIDRMLKYGTSFVDPCSVADLIKGNRAGPNETTITLEEIIKQLRDELK